MRPSDRKVRIAGALLVAAGLTASGLAILAEELGLGAEAARGMFGWKRITLLVVGVALAAVGALLLARPRIAGRLVDWDHVGPRDRKVRIAGALLVAAGLTASGLAILAEELGLGVEAVPGTFGWRRMTLLAVGVAMATLGTLFLAERSRLHRRLPPWRAALLPTLVAAATAILMAHFFFDLTIEVTRIGNPAGATVLLGLLVVLLALPPRRAALALAGAVGAWFLTLSLAVANLELITPDPVVSKAVGDAAYLAVPSGGRLIGLTLGIGAGLVVIASCVVLQRRRRRPAVQKTTSTAAGPVARDTRAGDSPVLAVLVSAAIAAILVVPDLDSLYLPPPAHYWDVSNYEVWDYFVWQGLVPMADFWYPYGSQWLYSLVPWGPLIKWLVWCAMIALAAWSLWRLSATRGVAVGLCLLALPLIHLWGTPELSEPSLEYLGRYPLAFLVALSYAALGPARYSRPAPAHLVFGAACLLATFIEADLILYGLAGCGLVLTGDLLSGVLPWRPVAIVRGLLVDAIPVVAALGFVLAFWVATGTAEGNLRFFTGLDAVSASAATPHLTNPTLTPSAAALYVALPGLLIATAFAHLLLARRPNRAVSSILLAAAGVTLLFVFKHLVRPVDYNDNLLAIPIVATLWSTILLFNLRTPAVAGAAGAFLAAFALTLESQRPNTLGNYASLFVESPPRVVDFARLPAKSEEFEQRQEERFRPESYAEAPEVGMAAEFANVVGARQPGTAPEFAVLGDAQLLYMFFDQDPPYHVELYGSSPIAEQRAMLEALERDSPPYLVWRRDFRMSYYRMDAPPYQIRNPLIFAWATRNYAPADPAQATPEAPMHVLRKRRANEPVPVGYWHRALGPTELGFLPSYSRLDEAPRCAGGPGCAPVAVLSGGPPSPWRVLELRVGDGGRSFPVTLAPREAVESYPVRLDRLWFWPLVGTDAHVEAVTPGWGVEIIEVESDDLY